MPDLNLHDCLKALGPCKFSDIPQQQEELDPFLADLFSQAQAVVESIPIPDPDPTHRNRSHTTGSIAPTNASEMFVSSARSPPPAPEYAALQQEWGKPIKLAAKDNPLGIAVYKLGSKDGKGAWFARRSVHEGLGFSRFKRGFEREFPTSLAVQGKPGEGNIRGIGAETRVEEITVPNRGKLEVYRLSAQFPGPTTPRDFVTLLVTSSKAMKHHGEADLVPRHYMIVSKPCDHPETQPRPGFIRGQYESVEFIREVPRKLKATMSSTDLTHMGHHRTPSPSLEKDVLKRNAEKHASAEELHGQHLRVDTRGSGQRDPSPGSRKRSVTVDAPASPIMHSDPVEPFDPEENPVEWIMVTRSDPGGSVPRFMVERGTPGSICADAVKFLDWAYQRDDEQEALENVDSRPHAHRRESFASWEANGTLAGIREHEEGLEPVEQSPPHTPKASASQGPSMDSHDAGGSAAHGSSSPSQFLNQMTETIASYTPQIVGDRLPHFGQTQEAQVPQDITKQGMQPAKNVDGGDDDDDASSTISTASFTSADSHITSDAASPSVSSKSLTDQSESQLLQQHDKEVAKLAQRRAAMDAKFAKQREKLASQTNKDSEKEQNALKKAEEKHQKELKKQEERYQKEIAKLEQKKKREAQKLEEKRRKQADKDEKARLTRERDEARAELDHLKREQDLLTRQVGELQKENTTLMARIGKLEGSSSSVDSPGSGNNRLRAMTLGQETRGRSSSLMNRKKDRDESGIQHS
ncbi:Bet v1-like protein [Cladophialophora carrionii]|uniref:Bet v1-like protein n=1 Tax=Cladophialophora carrionii TaxID=86049 RepID=A0A1C1CZA4_9EURO|nr:Bet v1-like protein [Cladophialophora carrionii]